MGRLDRAVKQQLARPLKYLFYGPAGIGKTTLACGARNAVSMDIEGSSSEISVARYPFKDGPADDPSTYKPGGYQDFIAGIRDVAETGKDLGYEHLIIDSVNVVQALIVAWVLDSSDKGAGRNPKKYSSISDFPYGTGPSHVMEVFHDFLAEIDAVVDAGISVILIGHEGKATVKNASGTDYDVITPGLQATDKSNVCTLLDHHCDVIGYVHPLVSVREVQTQKDSKTGNEKRKGKASGDGTRMVELTSSPSFRAKARPVGLPERFELPPADERPWSWIEYGVEAGRISPNERRERLADAAKKAGADPDSIARITALADDDITPDVYIRGRRKFEFNL